MEKIAIIVDSTTLLSEELKQHPDIYSVPLAVIVDGADYLDGIDVKEAQWIDYLTRDVSMTTSQPSLKNTVDMLKQVKEKNYDRVYVLPVTRHLSGTMNGFEIAQNMVQVPHLELIDTLSIAGVIAVMVEVILDLNQHNKTVEEIKTALNYIGDHNETFIYPSTLSRLIKSGRMNKTVGSIVNTLKLKILLTFRHKGEQIEKYQVCRTEKKLMSEIITAYQQAGFDRGQVIFYVLKVNSVPLIEEMIIQLKNQFPQAEIREELLPGVIATHVGLNVLGIQGIKWSD